MEAVRAISSKISYDLVDIEKTLGSRANAVPKPDVYGDMSTTKADFTTRAEKVVYIWDYNPYSTATINDHKGFLERTYRNSTDKISPINLNDASNTIIDIDTRRLTWQLWSVDGISSVHVTALLPELNLVILAEHDYLPLFDVITDIILDFELDRNLHIAYICGNEKEKKQLVSSEIYSVPK